MLIIETGGGGRGGGRGGRGGGGVIFEYNIKFSNMKVNYLPSLHFFLPMYLLLPSGNHINIPFPPINQVTINIKLLRG